MNDDFDYPLFSAKSLGVVFVSVIGRVLLGWAKLLCPPRAFRPLSSPLAESELRITENFTLREQLSTLQLQRVSKWPFLGTQKENG